jgi:heme oxygenase
MANIMQQLKESTRESHNNAESQEFQRLLASGDLPRNLYVKYLEQLWIIVAKNSALNGVITDDQLQVPFLQQDLEFFGSDPRHVEPTPATQWILGRLDKSATEGPALIGSHYVLLGSKHGGKFIAHSLQQKYHLNEGKGAIILIRMEQTFSKFGKVFPAP